MNGWRFSGEQDPVRRPEKRRCPARQRADRCKDSDIIVDRIEGVENDIGKGLLGMNISAIEADHIDAQTIVHEWGHNFGLHHTPEDKKYEHYLMYPF